MGFGGRTRSGKMRNRIGMVQPPMRHSAQGGSMATRQRQIRRVDYVDPRGYEYFDVDIDVLVPDPENPRIPPQEFETLETMLAIFRRSPNGLFKLAEDLAKVGTNPAELLNVTRLSDHLFLVKEGNRRLTARKLLRNPEQLRGHVTPGELRRWQKLATRVTPQLSTRQLIVVGENHDPWVFRRHQGYLEGVGVDQWDREAKFRDQLKKLGKRNRAMALIDALKANFPDKFSQFPNRSFSIFERFMDSSDSRSQLGLDVDDNGHLKLTRGERSLRMLEEIFTDIQRPRTDPDRLTTRRINTVAGAHEYLQEIDSRIAAESSSEDEITLAAPDASRATARPVSAATATTRRPRKDPDVLKSFKRPESPRLSQIFTELGKAKRYNLPNSAMVMTRVLLELSIDEYSNRVGVNFEAGDPDLAQEIQELRKFLGVNGYKVPKKLARALNRAAALPPTLSDKLVCRSTRTASREIRESD